MHLHVHVLFICVCIMHIILLLFLLTDECCTCTSYGASVFLFVMLCMDMRTLCSFIGYVADSLVLLAAALTLCRYLNEAAINDCLDN